MLSEPWRVSLRALCRLTGRREWFLPTGGWSSILSIWEKPCQGVCLLGSYELRNTLSILSADVQQSSCPDDFLALGVPALESLQAADGAR